MIHKINQEIKELEREWEKLRKSSERKPLIASIYVQFRQTEAKLEQAKKDKKIIEEVLEDLKQNHNNHIIQILNKIERKLNDGRYNYKLIQYCQEKREKLKNQNEN